MLSTAVLHPPRTLLGVFKMLPEGTRAELIDNALYMSPAPTLDHQEITISLGSQLFSFIKRKKLGKVYLGPVDVYLNAKNAFQPDIVFVSARNKSILKTDGIYGSPNLIIEVLSPETKNIDLTKKKNAYEQACVNEYWVIDPKTKMCTGFQLVSQTLIEFKKEKGKLSSVLLKNTFKF